ncbi:MAG: hypothetical protein R3B57_11225 [Phycisphaerales bacterium]
MIGNDLLRWRLPEEDADARLDPNFRADMDQSGDWYVWRRMGANGWATLRRCDGREDAQRLATQLNAREIAPR